MIVTDDAPADCANLRVTYILRHAQHGHAQDQKRACSGTFDTADQTHAGAQDIGALVVAEYTDGGGLKAIDEADVPRDP